MYSGKISGILLEIKVASSVAVQVLFFQLKCYVLLQSIIMWIYIYIYIYIYIFEVLIKQI